MYLSMLKSAVGFRLLVKCKLVLFSSNTSNNAGSDDFSFCLHEIETTTQKQQVTKTI